MEKKIERKQIILIKIAQGKLALSDDTYRTMLNERYWVNTCKGLSYTEATDLIDHLKTLGFKIKNNPGRGDTRSRRPRRAGANNIAYLPSKPQLDYIEHLRRDIRWRIGPDGYYHWLMKWLKKDSIATSREASKVIEGLKGLLKRQEDNHPGLSATPPYQGGESK